MGDQWLTVAPLYDLAILAVRLGQPRAAPLLEDSLVLSREHGDRRRIAKCLDGFAGLAAEAGRPARAARLLGGESLIRFTRRTDSAPA